MLQEHLLQIILHRLLFRSEVLHLGSIMVIRDPEIDAHDLVGCDPSKIWAPRDETQEVVVGPCRNVHFYYGVGAPLGHEPMML